EMLGLAEGELREAYKITQKSDRYSAVDAVKAKVKAHFLPEEGEARYTPEEVGSIFKHLQAKIVRWNILDTKSRIYGRNLETVRPIVSEVGLLPRTNGSALFTRGET
ncbi:polyribonucleotide nucleotidyltransferase, partial [Rhizobium leguminosarum]